MCSPSTPSAPAPAPVDTTVYAPPTYANAEVQKAGQKVVQKTGTTSSKNIKTSSQGLGDDVTTKKQKLGE